LRYCPNPECPYAVKHGEGQEYRDEARLCADCGAELVEERHVWKSRYREAGPGRTASLTDLRELLCDEAITMVFQPIVELPVGSLAGYEALGRGSHPGLPESPLELFQVAGLVGPDAQAELSRLFRRKAVELAGGRTDLPTIFLNTHPVELARPGLVESLEELRAVAPPARSRSRDSRECARTTVRYGEAAAAAP
jgi:hypothetical protein